MVNAMNIFTALPIVILEPYFVCKFADVVFKGTEIDQKERKYLDMPEYVPAQPNDPNAFYISECRYKSGSKWFGYGCLERDDKSPKVLVKNNPQREAGLEEVKVERWYFDNKKYIFLLIAGVIGTVMSTMYYNKYKGVATGTFIGSLIVICYATYVNWHNINEMGKLGLSGLALGGLIYSGVKYFSKSE